MHTHTHNLFLVDLCHERYKKNSSGRRTMKPDRKVDEPIKMNPDME